MREEFWASRLLFLGPRELDFRGRDEGDEFEGLPPFLRSLELLRSPEPEGLAPWEFRVEFFLGGRDLFGFSIKFIIKGLPGIV